MKERTINYDYIQNQVKNSDGKSSWLNGAAICFRKRSKTSYTPTPNLLKKMIEILAFVNMREYVSVAELDGKNNGEYYAARVRLERESMIKTIVVSSKAEDVKREELTSGNFSYTTTDEGISFLRIISDQSSLNAHAERLDKEFKKDLENKLETN